MKTERVTPSPPTRERASVAVLPFENAGGNPDHQYIADGIAEEVTRCLVEIPDLRVAAQASAFSFRELKNALPSVAETLNVETLLQGDVRRVGDRIQARARLVEPRSGAVLWSQAYEVSAAELPSLGREIAKAVTQSLRPANERVPAAPPGLQAAAPRSEAYDFYLRGRFVMGHRGEGNLRKALEYFERSAASDPEFQPAQIGIAQILGLLSYYGFARPHDVMPRARMAAERAIQLDESVAEAHAALAFVLLTYDWAWEEAETEYRRSLALNPADPDTLAYFGFYYLICIRGRAEEGMDLIWRGIDIAPVASIPLAILGVAVVYTGRIERAVPRIAEAVERHPSSWILQRSLGMAFAAEGRLQEAGAALERAARLSNRNPWTLMDLGTFKAEIGESEAARDIQRDLEQIARERYLQPMALAAIPAALGEADEAMPALRKAYEERDGIMIVMREYPPFHSLRGDSRFAAIREAMRIEP